jgi:PD-(D/E)XK nuclease superfamily protein
MKCPRRPPKVIGEWVELEFMARAARAGLTVSKPYGDSAPFDFIVGRRHPLHRVQVRGTSTFANSRSYVCHVAHGHPPARYTTGEIDFMAMYVMPYSAWYIIPMDSIPLVQRSVSLYPHQRRSRRGRLEHYREAWHLLGGGSTPETET